MSSSLARFSRSHPGSTYLDPPQADQKRLVLRDLSEADRCRWDEFVAGHPDGTFFHRSGWHAVVEKAFGHRTRYVFAERGGRITGVLPLVHVESALFGNALISSPFCVCGGPLGDDEESLDALRQYAIREMELLHADRVEFRLTEASNAPDWLPRSGLYAIFRRDIDADNDRNLKAVPRKQRAVIRKSLELDLTAACDPDTRRFHRIYSESLRNLGTPAFPRRYFDILMEEFGDCCEISTISDRARPVAAVMSFFFRDEVLPYYGGATKHARSRGVYDFMYWDVMRRAAARGCRIFDFGRSKIGTGSYAFKKNWGFLPQPLTYEFRLRRGTEPPEINPLNPKYRLYIALWKRLPLPVANFVGPYLVRSLG